MAVGVAVAAGTLAGAEADALGTLAGTEGVDAEVHAAIPISPMNRLDPWPASLRRLATSILPTWYPGRRVYPPWVADKSGTTPDIAAAAG